MPTPEPNPLTQLVVEQRRSNYLKMAIVFAILASSAPVWVPGLFWFCLIVYSFMH